MGKDRNGNYKSKSTMKVVATEVSRKVEFEIPENEQNEVTAGLIKNNHLRLVKQIQIFFGWKIKKMTLKRYIIFFGLI